MSFKTEMAVATRSAIQKEIFSPMEERLVALVNVTKPGRKKKSSFLCLSGRPSVSVCVLELRTRATPTHSPQAGPASVCVESEASGA